MWKKCLAAKEISSPYEQLCFSLGHFAQFGEVTALHLARAWSFRGL